MFTIQALLFILIVVLATEILILTINWKKTKRLSESEPEPIIGDLFFDEIFNRTVTVCDVVKTNSDPLIIVEWHEPDHYDPKKIVRKTSDNSLPTFRKKYIYLEHSVEGVSEALSQDS